jgi:hypothetical protein
MFGSSEDRARQLAARARWVRQSSSGTHGSGRTPSGSSLSSMPPLVERHNQQPHSLVQQPMFAPGQSVYNNQRRVHTLPANAQPYSTPHVPHGSFYALHGQSGSFTNALVPPGSLFNPQEILPAFASEQGQTGSDPRLGASSTAQAQLGIFSTPQLQLESFISPLGQAGPLVHPYSQGRSPSARQQSSLPRLSPTPFPQPVQTIDTRLPPSWTYASPALTYFEWDDHIRGTKHFPLWNEPITTFNSPGFGTFYNNLSDVEKARFHFEFHGNPWGQLSVGLTAKGKQTWFQSLSPGNQATFRRIVLYRRKAVQNAGPHAHVQLDSTPSRPSIMLWEALEAIDTRYISRVTFTDGSHARLPSRSASSPVLSTTGDGVSDWRSFSTYSISCLIALLFALAISFPCTQ